MQNIFEFGILQNYKKCANQSINQTAYVRRGVYQPHCAVVIIRFLSCYITLKPKADETCYWKHDSPQVWLIATRVTVSRDFLHSLSKKSIWTLYEQAKIGFVQFIVFAKIFAKIREKTWSLTILKRCRRGH